MIRAKDAIKNRAIQNFKEDLYIANKAEKAVATWIDKQNAYEKVIVVNEKGYDIQCFIKKPLFQNSNKISYKKIEVKRDFWIDSYHNKSQGRKGTNNICVEIWSNFPAGNPGWIYYSDSDYIYYVGNEKIYILSTPRLKYITEKLINIGRANIEEPTLKKNIPDHIAKIQYSAFHNGNYKVRSLLVNKNWLNKTGCILRTIDRETSEFNKIANLYEI